MNPILKWAGGKRRLVKKIVEIFPKDYQDRHYHEPFFGGGAVFFHIEPGGGSINDINPRLINFYRVLRDKPMDLIEEASKYRYEEGEYYENRDRFNAPGLPEVEDAALLLYLNKTTYNGLYRVNSKGEFNVPFGRYDNPTIVDDKSIMQSSRLLKNIKLFCSDFSYVLDVVDDGDLCYLDPPYYPVSETSKFTDYSVYGFEILDQVRLRDMCIELDQRNVSFVLSNSDTEAMRGLYEDIECFDIVSLRTSRMISSKVSSRNSGRDLIVTNCGLSVSARNL